MHERNAQRQVLQSCSCVQVLLNFRTGFLDKEHNLVVDRSRIAKSYLKGWFTVDVISVLPFQEMLTSESLGFVQLLKGARVQPHLHRQRYFRPCMRRAGPVLCLCSRALTSLTPQHR